MSITIRVRELREQRGWSQSEVARRAGVRQATLYVMESGKSKGIDFETLKRLAVAFDTHPAVFIEWHEPRGRKQR